MQDMSFTKIETTAVPSDPTGYSLVDLYVHLPTLDRYIRFVAAGDMLTDEKKEALKKHPTPFLFIREEETGITSRSLQLSEGDETKVFPADGLQDAGMMVLSVAQQKRVQQIFENLVLGDGADAHPHLNEIAATADEVLRVVAPEVKDIKDHLIKTSRLVHLMSDSSAITTIAILFAFSNDFGSQKAYRDLAMACLLMDAGMAEFSNEEVRQYYLDRYSLPQDVLKRIMLHPTKSHDLAKAKIPTLTEGTLMLIHSHHELFSGKGFPRGVRTESLFPLVKVLAFAVDVFETLKKAELEGDSYHIEQAVARFQEVGVEAHLRQHNRRLVETVAKFLAFQSERISGESA